NGAEGLSVEEQQTLAGLRQDYRRYFPVPDGHIELLLFRLARAEPPTARSLRRPGGGGLAFEWPDFQRGREADRWFAPHSCTSDFSGGCPCLRFRCRPAPGSPRPTARRVSGPGCGDVRPC